MARTLINSGRVTSRDPSMLAEGEVVEAQDCYYEPANPGLKSILGRVAFNSSAEASALVGGGSAWLRPGELSLAANGVLFLDELGEFPPSVLDALRQPLEDGVVRVCRASGSASFPARVLLVAAIVGLIVWFLAR